MPDVPEFPQIIGHEPIGESPTASGAYIQYGPASTPLTAEEQAKETLGYTQPNLHRRIQAIQDHDRGHSYFIDPSQEEIEKYNLNLDAMAPNEYTLRICGTDSYRTTVVYLHDDSLDGGPGSGETEIP